MSTANEIYEEVKSLPEPLAQEVLDFVTFLKDRRGIESESDLVNAQSLVMNQLWDNDVDEVWNDA